MDDVTWAALTIALTVVGGIWTWLSFRRRGLAPALRAGALTLLPAAAYLTDTLRMLTRIVDAVVDWAVGLVLSPSVWAGIVVAGLAGVLWVVSGMLMARGRGVRGVAPAPDAPGALDGDPARGEVPAGRGDRRPAPAPAASSEDSELDDVEAILRRRGIT